MIQAGLSSSKSKYTTGEVAILTETLKYLGKVMFSQSYVILSSGEGGSVHGRGACRVKEGVGGEGAMAGEHAGQGGGCVWQGEHAW